MSYYAVVVRIRVLPGLEAAFEAATEDNHRNTRLEPGNVRFDVLKHESETGHYRLYEMYRSLDDFKVHQQAAHYFRWRDTVNPMMAEQRQGEKFHVLHPDPWE